MKDTNAFWSTPKGWAALALIAAVTYFLLAEHRTHVFQALPYLIFLACPLMHVFMHGGHGGHKHGAGNPGERGHDENSAHSHGCCSQDAKKNTDKSDSSHQHP